MLCSAGVYPDESTQQFWNRFVFRLFFFLSFFVRSKFLYVLQYAAPLGISWRCDKSVYLRDCLPDVWLRIAIGNAIHFCEFRFHENLCFYIRNNVSIATWRREKRILIYILEYYYEKKNCTFYICQILFIHDLHCPLVTSGISTKWAIRCYTQDQIKRKINIYRIKLAKKNVYSCAVKARKLDTPRDNVTICHNYKENVVEMQK